MFEAVLPNLALLFAPKELASDAMPTSSVRYRRRMIKQTLRDHGHWLDQDMLARLVKELDEAPPAS